MTTYYSTHVGLLHVERGAPLSAGDRYEIGEDDLVGTDVAHVEQGRLVVVTDADLAAIDASVAAASEAAKAARAAAKSSKTSTAKGA